MDHFHGITAEIISNGQVLNFYDDPDAAEIEGSHARYHYVEAVAGSTFVVKVYLTPQSKFYPMEAENAVRVRLQIDGHDNLVTNQYTRESLQERFSRGKTETFAFSGPRYFCKDTEQWMRSEYSFRNLVLSMLGLSFSVKYYHGSNKIFRRDSRFWSFREASSGPRYDTNCCPTRQKGEVPNGVRPERGTYHNDR